MTDTHILIDRMSMILVDTADISLTHAPISYLNHTRLNPSSYACNIELLGSRRLPDCSRKGRIQATFASCMTIINSRYNRPCETIT